MWAEGPSESESELLMTGERSGDRTERYVDNSLRMNWTEICAYRCEPGNTGVSREVSKRLLQGQKNNALGENEERV
jgi:hypothetical protein